MNIADALKRAVSLSMAGVLLATAPGFGVTQAVAAVVTAGVQVNPSLGGMNLGAAGVGVVSQAGVSSRENGRGASLPSLSGSLSSVLLPSPIVGSLGTQSPAAAAAGVSSVAGLTGPSVRVAPATLGTTVPGAAPSQAASRAQASAVSGRTQAGADWQMRPPLIHFQIAVPRPGGGGRVWAR